MEQLPIINAHAHFVIEIPNGFPNKVLSKVANTKVGFGILAGFLHVANPFSKHDNLDKLLQFIRASKDENMLSMFNKWRKEGGYSERTKVVVLTVNMAYMGSGKVKRTFGEVCEELERLRQDYPNNIIPFFHADCRSGNMNQLFNYYVGHCGWGGVKFYNSMGTFPQDTRYDYILNECERLNKPVIAHCTYSNPIHFKGSEKELAILLGGFYDKKATRKENCNKFTSPYNWLIVAQKYPNLRIDLAHGGGQDAWLEWQKDNTVKNVFTDCLDAIRTHDNIYMDISFTMNNRKLWSVLKMLLTFEEYSYLFDKILGGTDWYMSKTECTEQQYMIDFRQYLGEELFNKIFRINTHKFLYG